MEPWYPRPALSRREDQPIELDSTPVWNRGGEDLSEIWWRGAQWAVTSWGICCLDGTYWIDAKDLMNMNLATHWGGWPEHIGRKGWPDTEEFCTAWLVAIALHGPKGELIRQALALSPPRNRGRKLRTPLKAHE
jgi:hypothetical protein